MECFYPSKEAHEEGLRSSRGAFESFLIHKERGVCLSASYPKHLSRLQRALASLGLPNIDEALATSKLKELCCKMPDDCSIHAKIIATTASCSFGVKEFEPRFGSSLRLFPYASERHSPSVKSIDSSVSKLSHQSAIESGFDEALLINTNGIIRETSWGNFFWIRKDDVICTSENNILPGITRNILLEKILKKGGVKFGDFTFEELLVSAKEAFVSSALHGVTPVSLIGDMPLTNCSFSSFLKEAYHKHIEENLIPL